MSQRLLREYINTILREEYDGSGDGMYTSRNDGMGTWGSPGAGDLYAVFVSPFTDVLKTAVGKSKEVARRARTLLRVALETVITTLNPFVESSYSEIFQKESQDIQAIRGQYKDVYDRTSKALGGDVAATALLMLPGPALAVALVKKAPRAAVETLSVLSGGMSDRHFKRSLTNGKIFLGNRLMELSGEEKRENKKAIEAGIEAALKDPKVLNAIEQKTKPLRDEIIEAKFEKLEAVEKLAMRILKAKNTGDVSKALGSAKSKADAAVNKKMKELKMSPEESKNFQSMMQGDELPAGVFAVMKKKFADPLQKELKALEGNRAPNEIVKRYKDVIAKINNA